MLLIDKYFVTKLENFITNDIELIDKIKQVTSNNMPHILLSGFTGKKTIANIIISEKYKTTLRLKSQIMELKHGSKAKTIKFLLKVSQFHFQLNPSLSGVYDRFIIQKYIMDVITNTPLSLPYYIFVIEDADKLTLDAQQCLRRTLETQITKCRFIFLCNNSSTLIEPLISRCMKLSISSPSNINMAKIIKNILTNENIKYSKDSVDYIIKHGNNNTRKTINILNLILEENKNALITNEYEKIDILSINKYIEELITYMKNNNIPELRSLIYKQLTHCIDPLDIIKNIYFYIIDNISLTTNKFIELTSLIDYYENTYKKGSKPIYHIEGFCISIISNKII